MTIDRALKPKGAGAAVLLAIMISVSGCTTSAIEDTAPQAASSQVSGSAVQADNGLAVPPPARTSGRVPQYPNLAETRRTAAPQFSDEELASTTDTLRARRTSLASAARDPIRDQAEFLREIGRTHGDNTLRQIEER